jgi:hypothetical protein
VVQLRLFLEFLELFREGLAQIGQKQEGLLELAFDDETE